MELASRRRPLLLSPIRAIAGLVILLVLVACANSDEEPGAFDQPAVAQAAPERGAAIDGLDRVAALEDDRARWADAGIGTYSYRARVFASTTVSEQPTGCGAGGATLAVTVVDGSVVSAHNEDAACSIDLDDPQRLPLTGDEVFERALKFANVSPGLELTIADSGFPERIFVESEIGFFEFGLLEFDADAAGPSGGGFETLRVELADARDRWAQNGFSDYSIETQNIGWALVRPPIETLVGGVPVDGDEVGGVEALFDFIELAIDDDADSIFVVFDIDTGAPIRISGDFDSTTIDDEFQLDVLSLIPADASDVSIADVLEQLGAQIGGAPDGSLTLDGARYCGLDQISNEPAGGEGVNPIARRCFTSGVERDIPSLLVQVQPTVEGDPIVSVLRADGSEVIDVHTDSSQDTLGSGGWSSRKCLADNIRYDDTLGLNYFNVSC